MKIQNRLFLFFIITGSGSVLSALATFVRIEWVFHNMQALGLALSVKTISALFVSHLAGSYLSKVGTKRALIHSQFVGLLALVALYTGFRSENLPLVLLGIILSSIPMVIVNVGVISQGRIFSNGEETFRRFSAKIQSGLGIYFRNWSAAT